MSHNRVLPSKLFFYILLSSKSPMESMVLCPSKAASRFEISYPTLMPSVNQEMLQFVTHHSGWCYRVGSYGNARWVAGMSSGSLRTFSEAEFCQVYPSDRFCHVAYIFSITSAFSVLSGQCVFAFEFLTKRVCLSSNTSVRTSGLLKTHPVTGVFHLAMSSRLG